jgi:serine/threonine protein kinase
MEVVDGSISSTVSHLARYELAELLGEGGSGSTYRAMRLADQAAVAIKVLSLRHLQDWKQLELFEREAQVLSQLSHPQIPQYLDYFHVDTADNRTFYLVQQLATGKPLTEWVQSGWRGTEAEVKDIARQLLEILQYLHQQSPPLVHRDIKPHNIIRSDDGRVFLVDFGAVQQVYHNTLLKGSTVAGTYGYMAPEQFRGAAVPGSDLYGLGATILFLLTHRSPAELPQERLKLSFRSHVNISEQFADWLETMLEPDVLDRFPSAEKALKFLQTAQPLKNFGNKNSRTSWQGATGAVVSLIILWHFIYEYRYPILEVAGIESGSLCQMIIDEYDSAYRSPTANDKAGTLSLDNYLFHGGNVNAVVVISDIPGEGKSSKDTGTLLHCAIENSKNEIVKDLLERGADPNSKSTEIYRSNSSVNGEEVNRIILTPLQRADNHKNAEARKHLIDHGAKM